MAVLTQHRERVAQLRSALDQLVALHSDLQERRNEVLTIQAKRGESRQSQLLVTRTQIHAISRQIDQLRSQVFGTRPGLAGTLAQSLVDSFSGSYSIWLNEGQHGQTGLTSADSSAQ